MMPTQTQNPDRGGMFAADFTDSRCGWVAMTNGFSTSFSVDSPPPAGGQVEREIYEVAWSGVFSRETLGRGSLVCLRLAAPTLLGDGVGVPIPAAKLER